MFVHDLNLFVTVQLLDETLAVLSLGKLCEDHGYSYEWVSGQNHISLKTGFEYSANGERGQKPRLTKDGKNHLHGRFRTSCRSRVIRQS